MNTVRIPLDWLNEITRTPEKSKWIFISGSANVFNILLARRDITSENRFSIDFEYNPKNIDISNGDKWEKLATGWLYNETE